MATGFALLVLIEKNGSPSTTLYQNGNGSNKFNQNLKIYGRKRFDYSKKIQLMVEV